MGQFSVGVNKVLKHAVENARIFEAWSDEEWVNEGAALRVSLVCVGRGERRATLDGKPVAEIYSDLTADTGASSVDLTLAQSLAENRQVAFMGITKVGSFDIEGEQAREWLKAPNPNGRRNSEVLRPSWNGLDLTRRPRDRWIIDFGTEMGEVEASMFEAPFAYARAEIYPTRQENNREAYRVNWWRHGEARPGLRAKIGRLNRYIATPEVAKHRTFVFLNPAILPDKNLQVITRDDDTTLGVLHSHIHEVWALRMGTRRGAGNDPRYTPTTCFETFPFPADLTPNIDAKTYASDARATRIAAAARALVEARDRWLNPPEWTDRIPEVVAGYPERIVAKPEHAAELKKRTLTNLYNERPAWLDNLHRELDTAVAAAYGWEWPLTDDEILRRLFELNQMCAR